MYTLIVLIQMAFTVQSTTISGLSAEECADLLVANVYHTQGIVLSAECLIEDKFVGSHYEM